MVDDVGKEHRESTAKYSDQATGFRASGPSALIHSIFQAFELRATSWQMSNPRCSSVGTQFLTACLHLLRC